MGKISKFNENFIRKCIAIAYNYPVRILGIFLFISLATIFVLRSIKIDTNLIHLLPDNSPSVVEAKELQNKVGDGGQFIVVYYNKNADTAKLHAAVNFTAAKLKKMPEVRNVQFKYPQEFVSKYKYLLIPNDYLNEVVEQVIKLEAENNPFSDNLLDEGEGQNAKKETHGEMENRQDMEILIQQYLNMPEYHESADGKVCGLLVPTKDGITSLGNIQKLHDHIKQVTDEASEKFGVEGGITGNHMNKLIEYNKLMHDLQIASIIAFFGILIILWFSFRNFWRIVAVIIPLLFGMMWAFAFIPFTFGSLNLITSFLVVILYGIGIDYSIHILKRFSLEVAEHNLVDALYITYMDTGKSVVMSAVTTFVGFLVVSFSTFRGFYEYGVLSCLTIIMILLAMYVVLPSILVLLYKFGKIEIGNPEHHKSKIRYWVPGKTYTLITGVVFIAGLVVAFTNFKFDYFLSNTQFSKNSSGEHERLDSLKNKVYSASMSPAAIYAARDINTLDSINAVFAAAQKKKGSMINRIRSIRDFAPNKQDLDERHALLAELSDLLEGSWTDKVEDPAIKKILNDFKNWKMPDRAPKVNELPEFISSNLKGMNNSGYYLSTIYPTLERKDGRNAMEFTKELYSLKDKIPAGVKGPVGETIVFADVLSIVFSELWWIILFGLIGVFGTVLVMQQNFKISLIMMIPVTAGLMLGFGICAACGVKLTFFNVVCITGLLGMGVDGGIHYVSRWLYNKKNIRIVQQQLVPPIASSFLTVIISYFGMVLTQHSGLRSMGLLSSVCMLSIMFANLVFLPGILKILESRKK